MLSLGIDTVRFFVTATSLENFLKSNRLKTQSVIKKEAINQYIDYFYKNEDIHVDIVKIGNIKNISGYILIKQNLNSQNVSKNSKRQKNYKYEVIFAGLKQPTKNIHIGTYEVLNLFVNRFKVSNIDMSFDGINHTEIIHIRNYFDNYISTNTKIKVYKNSLYINNPYGLTDDADFFKRILVYDKYRKEFTNKPHLNNEQLKGWKRLEVTIDIDKKLKDIEISDYVYDVKKMAKNIFSFGKDDEVEDYINVQLNLMTDRRKHSQANKEKLYAKYRNNG